MDVPLSTFQFPINQFLCWFQQTNFERKTMSPLWNHHWAPFLIRWEIQIVHFIYWGLFKKRTCSRNQNKWSRWTSPLGQTLFFRATWEKDKNFYLLTKVGQSLQKKTTWRLLYFLAIYESLLKGQKGIQNYEDKKNWGT